jgi:hypothetical protein
VDLQRHGAGARDIGQRAFQLAVQLVAWLRRDEMQGRGGPRVSEPFRRRLSIPEQNGPTHRWDSPQLVGVGCALAGVLSR